MSPEIFLEDYFSIVLFLLIALVLSCGFILLKRGGKPGNICELVTVSVGPKALEKANKILNNMISAVRRKIFLKNRNSCTYCSYKNTKHCV